ncbi:glycogen debranching protein [Methylobacterium tarhaniae]|uniref:Glycogen debranching protein n=1 Tax=Methylobacterium tarhaniae TaxID=1187852 RepID=A0A0J6STB2_9HYPH|nr:amylo-alpha-1,6-glucosidase [Methylobacterium tarhaniae]KMO36954.1 glycogen debranching protein [Methylobacterium tarhaniae]
MDDAREWLEADGLGGFASGPVAGPRRRRYHALLLTATTPPTGRVVLVNGIEAEVATAGGTVALSTQHYAPDVIHPDGWRHIADVSLRPWPRWTYRLPDGSTILHEVLVEPESCETLLRWQRLAGSGPCILTLRPLLSGRDYHALHHENPAFAFAATVQGGNVCWRPYPDLPAVAALTNGAYAHEPEWYRNFLYTAERDRGLDAVEDLGSPGRFTFDLAAGPAAMVLRSGDGLGVRAAAHAEHLLAGERARREALSPLALAAGAYLVDRPGGRTLVAGFPWFTDWGRDTFIALRGLLVATGALAQARAILLAWAGAVSEGMMPNRFPDRGEAPDYNAVDASLWYVVAVHDVLAAHAAADRPVRASEAARLAEACTAILDGYAAGTRYGIAADADGLLRAGVPGMQLTWMDAKVGDWVVTPRIGKPVEVQALWINALRIGAARWSPHWRELEQRASASVARFVSPSGALYDVIDADHVPGAVDARLRPNQILAVGGLPSPLLTGAPARAVVDAVETRLLTPLGLRSLDPADADYRGAYAGGPRERDGAYHQGTVWPWLIGPFVDAWLSVRGRSPEAKAEARARFLPPLDAHLEQAGLGHVSEVADGDAPHRPGGCPFQAWSLGELIRVRRMLDLDPV